jgi:hypothetical protein
MRQFLLMSNLSDILELVDIRQLIQKLEQRQDKILHRMEQRERYSSAEIEYKFPSKIAAAEHIIKQAEKPLHTREINVQMSRFGFPGGNELALSGMLRKYSAERKTFTAEGGNTFGLIEWQSFKK